MIFVIVFIILSLPITLIFPTKVIHKERMPKGKKAIVTSNHYSNLDVFIYDVKFARKFRYMAKIELFKNKFLGWLVKSMGAFPVDREKVTPSVFKKTISILNKNKQVFIFPEGSRNKEGDETLHSVKSGIITFASKGEAEIVPMLMYRPPKLFRKNYIIVGEPFKVVGENPKKLTKEEIDKNIEIYTEKMNALRIEIDEYVLSRKRKKNKSNK